MENLNEIKTTLIQTMTLLSCGVTVGKILDEQKVYFKELNGNFMKSYNNTDFFIEDCPTFIADSFFALLVDNESLESITEAFKDVRRYLRDDISEEEFNEQTPGTSRVLFPYERDGIVINSIHDKDFVILGDTKFNRFNQ